MGEAEPGLGLKLEEPKQELNSQKVESAQRIEKARKREKVKVTVVLSKEIVDMLKETYGNRGISVVIDSLLRAVLLNQKPLDWALLALARTKTQSTGSEFTYADQTNRSVRTAKRIICAAIYDGYQLEISRTQLVEYIQKIAGADPRTINKYVKLLETLDYVMKKNDKVYHVTHKALVDCFPGGLNAKVSKVQ